MGNLFSFVLREFKWFKNYTIKSKRGPLFAIILIVIAIPLTTLLLSPQKDMSQYRSVPASIAGGGFDFCGPAWVKQPDGSVVLEDNNPVGKRVENGAPPYGSWLCCGTNEPGNVDGWVQKNSCTTATTPGPTSCTPGWDFTSGTPVLKPGTRDTVVLDGVNGNKWICCGTNTAGHTDGWIKGTSCTGTPTTTPGPSSCTPGWDFTSGTPILKPGTKDTVVLDAVNGNKWICCGTGAANVPTYKDGWVKGTSCTGGQYTFTATVDKTSYKPGDKVNLCYKFSPTNIEYDVKLYEDSKYLNTWKDDGKNPDGGDCTNNFTFMQPITVASNASSGTKNLKLEALIGGKVIATTNVSYTVTGGTGGACSCGWGWFPSAEGNVNGYISTSACNKTYDGDGGKWTCCGPDGNATDRGWKRGTSCSGGTNPPNPSGPPNPPGTSPTPTNTPTPAPTGTNPTGSPTATTAPTGTNPTATTAPTGVNPTATGAPASTNLIFVLAVDGVGNQTANGQNNNPTPNPMKAFIQITDISGNKVTETSKDISYDTNAGAFKGTVPVTIASGPYNIRAKFDNTLWKKISKTITSGQDNNLPYTKLINGDINQDNSVNILDYNIMISCLKKLQCQGHADLNLDGQVDAKDLNLLYYHFKNREGD